MLIVSPEVNYQLEIMVAGIYSFLLLAFVWQASVGFR